MKEVIVYSTGTCPYCFALMDWLDELGVKYQEKSAAEREDITSVPLTVIGEDEIVGFDRPAIKKALAKHGILE